MTKLTKEILDQALKLARQEGPIIKYQASTYWPRNKPDGVDIITCRAHPFVQWLARYIPFDPNEYFEVEKFTWADPIIVKDSAITFGEGGSGYTVFASEQQINMIKKGIK